MRRVISLLFLYLLSSCTKINTENKMVDNLLELNLQGFAQVISKVDMIMQEGIPIGIYVPFKDSSLSSVLTNYSNRLYFTETSGALIGGPVFLTVGKDYDIYGYAPYQYDVITPDSIAGFKSGDDVIIATKTSLINVNVTNSSSTLSFNHLVSQLSLIVVFEKKQIVDSTSLIEISGFYDSAVLDLTSNTLLPKGTAPTITANGANGILSLQPLCFFICKEKNMTLNIKIIVEGITYNGEISRQFVAGESYRYTVIIPTKNQELKITSKLTPWVPVETEVII